MHTTTLKVQASVPFRAMKPVQAPSLPKLMFSGVLQARSKAHPNSTTHHYSLPLLALGIPGRSVEHVRDISSR